MPSVAVIDYGMGNLHSISKALQHADPAHDIQIVSQAEQILSADRVVFPGVGAIKDCMQAIKASGLDAVILEVVQQKPVLGICLGMQALLSYSEENGNTECLNIFPGKVKHFPKGLSDNNGLPLKIPHMGWNEVQQQPHPLWNNIAQNSRFYFVHSYYALPDDDSLVTARSHYPQAFTCALSRENIFAVQFHPEKSQTVGLQLLKNFMNWNGQS